jgi:hypothetical protein
MGFTKLNFILMREFASKAQNIASLAGRSTPLDHVLGDAGPSGLKAELEPSAMDARRIPTADCPRWSAGSSPPDLCRLAAGLPGRGFPTPVKAEAGMMPTHQVSGRIIVIAFKIEGNHRYSRIRNKRRL